MADDPVANPKIEISADHKAAVKAFLETGAASKDLGKALQALGDKIEGSYKGKVDKVERGYQSFEKTVNKLASEIKGNGATAGLNQLALAVEKLGGAEKLTEVQTENLRRRIDSLKAAGGTVPPELAKITTEATKLQQALGAATSGQGFKGVLGAVSPEILKSVAGITGVVAAATAAGSKIGELAMATASYAERIKDLSDSHNIEVVALQRLAAAADAADLTLEDVVTASSRIAKGLIETPAKFEELGLSIQKLLAMSPDEQLFAVADAVRAIENPTKQTAVAMDILGKSGPEALRLLKSDMRGAADEAQRLGQIMSAEMIAQAAQLKDEIDKLNRSWDHLKLNLGTVVTGNEDAAKSVASITRVLGELSSFIANNREKIAGGFRDVAESIGAGAPAVALFIRLMDTAIAKAEQLPKKPFQAGLPAPVLPTIAPPGASSEQFDLLGKGLAQDIERTREELRKAAEKDEQLLAKVIADANERVRQDKDKLAKQLLKIQGDRLAAEKDAEAQGAKDQTESIRKTSDFLRERAKSDAAVVARAEDAIAEARIRGLNPIDAQIAKIEEARETALRHVRALELEGKISVDAANRARAAYDAAAEAERKYAQQQEALRKIALVRDLFSELGSIVQQLGFDADSTVGKVAKVGEDLAGTAEDFTRAGAAFASGDYLTAAVESLKGVGKLISAFKTAFSKPEWKKVMEDVGRDWGISISKGLAEAIAEDSKRLGDRVAATLLHLKEIIAEAGGVKAFGIERTIASLRDLFSQIETGKLSVREAGKVFDDVFGDLAEASVKAGQLASAQFLELIQLAKRFGVESAAVTDFLNRNAQAGMAGLKAFIESGILSTQGAATAAGAGLMQAFQDLVAGGKSPGEAFAELGPLIEKFREQLEKAGLDGGAVFAQLEAQAALFADEIAGPALQGMSGLVGWLVSLHNAGQLNQETFSAITEQIGATVEKLREQGIEGPALLQAMQPDLQKIWELQQDFGYSVDDATQLLLDQAEAAGIVGDAHRSAQDRMAAAAERTNEILEAMAKFFGVTIPEAAKRGADKVNEQLDRIKDREVDITLNVTTKKFGDGDGEGQAHGGMNTGITQAILHGTPSNPELVAPVKQFSSQLAQDLAAAVAAGGPGASGVAAAVQGDVYLDGERVGRWMQQGFVKNKGGMATGARVAVTGKA